MPAKLTTDQVNYLNAGLMIVACLAAFPFPFELFLLSYTVLGPLHYFTEISWLHDRNYFTRSRGAERYWLILVGAALLVLLYGIVADRLGWPVILKWEVAMVYLVLAAALAATVIASRAAVAGLAFATAVALIAFSRSSAYYIVSLFLITIIHVFVFTAAFVLYGALKSRSRSGILSLGVFVLCAASFFVYVPESSDYRVSEMIRRTYASFQLLNAHLLSLLHSGRRVSLREIYESTGGLAVMRLIAFAYTYHYLNWFSKTSIIKWHDVSKRRSALIIGLWLVSLGIYAWDFTSGMLVLYFASVMHVLLEFPLDHQTFVGIGRLLFGKKAPVAV